MMLNDNQLEKVTGGVSNEAIIKVINEAYGFIPGEIRTAIIGALNNLGKKAAKRLAEKFAKSDQRIEGIVDLLT